MIYDIMTRNMYCEDYGYNVVGSLDREHYGLWYYDWKHGLWAFTIVYNSIVWGVTLVYIDTHET